MDQFLHQTGRHQAQRRPPLHSAVKPWTVHSRHWDNRRQEDVIPQWLHELQRQPLRQPIPAHLLQHRSPQDCRRTSVPDPSIFDKGFCLCTTDLILGGAGNCQLTGDVPGHSLSAWAIPTIANNEWVVTKKKTLQKNFICPGAWWCFWKVNFCGKPFLALIKSINKSIKLICFMWKEQPNRFSKCFFTGIHILC